MKLIMRNILGLLLGAAMVIFTFGGTVSAAARLEGGAAKVARGNGGGVTLTCSSTKAGFKYTNLTGKTCFMEASGKVVDVLNNEITTIYKTGYTSGNISNSYSEAGIYNIVFYGHIYDGPSASYKCVDETISSYR